MRPRLLTTRLGASVETLIDEELFFGENRVISGSVLYGHVARGAVFGYVGRYANQISCIAGDHRRHFLGWMAPGWDLFSMTRAYASSLRGRSTTYDFTTKAHGGHRAMVPIGAFERRLITADRLDAFVSGQNAALSDEDLAGLEDFLDAGCVTCHMGPTIGGGMYRKLGLVKPYSTADPGRFDVTGDEADRFVFKVPSLRNIAMTGPYFHDGSIASLQEAIRLMAGHQLGIELSGEQVARIETFLGTLTGTVDPEYITAPELPESGPDTPAPDPS